MSEEGSTVDVAGEGRNLTNAGFWLRTIHSFNHPILPEIRWHRQEKTTNSILREMCAALAFGPLRCSIRAEVKEIAIHGTSPGLSLLNEEIPSDFGHIEIYYIRNGYTKTTRRKSPKH